MLLNTANVVFALNLYALCTANPVAIMFAASTFLPTLDFYYNGEYKTWWEKNSWWVMLVVGVVATIVACIAAPFTCGASMGAVAAIGATLAKIAITTAIGAAVSLAIGGVVAGVQSALTGHGFWQAFGDSVCENFVDALVTSFAMSAITVAVGNVIQTRHCFKEGTLVQTENGLKPIEEIQVGDKVLAYDEETGEQAFKPVKQLFRNETSKWCTVIVKSEKGQEAFEIISTPGHKYYLPDNVEKRDFGKPLEHVGYVGLSEKWVSAEELKFGDKVLLSDGTYGIIQSVKLEQLETPEATYNFEVEDFHTYYVGEQSVLVHNADCAFDNFVEHPEELYGKSADEVEKLLGSGWKKGAYGSDGTGWKFINGDKMVAYHPGGGRHVGSYYKLSSSRFGKIKLVGKDYVPSLNDKAMIINMSGGSL